MFQQGAQLCDSGAKRFAFLSFAGISIILTSVFMLVPSKPSYGIDVKPSTPEALACALALPASGHSSEDDPEPQIRSSAVIPGVRMRMPAFASMQYQLFLPASWKANGFEEYPVVVFLHGAGDGKFSVMNSQSLPRLLARDQSTSFDSRKCWCLDNEFLKVTAKREADAHTHAPFLDQEEDLHSPLADCDFADQFGAIVIMPQGWLPFGDDDMGWSRDKLQQVVQLTQHVIKEYRGDPSRVVLTGQSAGGAGAWEFAAWQPNLWSAVNVICAPTDPSVAAHLQGVPVWVVGWTGDGVFGNDDVVEALKQRANGSVRYTRYLKAPAPPDPKYRGMHNHASYDLIYRDPRLWEWAFAQKNPEAAERWSALMKSSMTKVTSAKSFGTDVVGRSDGKTESPEALACQQALPASEHTSEDDPEPQTWTASASPGVRMKMPAFERMEYQLFLPATWEANGAKQYPVVVFLHGAGDGKFSVMNSQSLPRLLARDQSTSFDSRKCWCLDDEFLRVTAKREAGADDNAPFLDQDEDLRSPLADCDFADQFGAIVIMPQGWLPFGDDDMGWSRDKLQRVVHLTQHVMKKYGGDPTRVVLTGQSAGGAGAWEFATWQPKLWSAVNVICAPADSSVAEPLEGVPIWVVGWTGDGISGNDEVVAALKQRASGSVRYTRYVKAPAPPDPKYRDMDNHASYDLIYRDPRLWQWAFAQQNAAATQRWQLV